jgi:hypothetical protein
MKTSSSTLSDGNLDMFPLTIANKSAHNQSPTNQQSRENEANDKMPNVNERVKKLTMIVVVLFPIVISLMIALMVVVSIHITKSEDTSNNIYTSFGLNGTTTQNKLISFLPGRTVVAITSVTVPGSLSFIGPSKHMSGATYQSFNDNVQQSSSPSGSFYIVFNTTGAIIVQGNSLFYTNNCNEFDLSFTDDFQGGCYLNNYSNFPPGGPIINSGRSSSSATFYCMLLVTKNIKYTFRMLSGLGCSSLNWSLLNVQIIEMK